VKPRWRNENDGRPLEERFPRVMALRTPNIEAATRDLMAKGLKPTQPLHLPDPVIGDDLPKRG
jgi:hypothetical protein